ncbi:unnamed protein product [Meloidogyne enterolobii]|uniref:Uncharacterized protein n=1 Tax=Meloidogyne enterolobii TaxID=390850 RepID=A0ACB0ZI34_MELEN
MIRLLGLFEMEEVEKEIFEKIILTFPRLGRFEGIRGNIRRSRLYWGGGEGGGGYKDIWGYKGEIERLKGIEEDIIVLCGLRRI